MDDKSIIELFFAHDEKAIYETKNAYGHLIREAVTGILGDGPEADMCEEDTYFGLVCTIPPERPEDLREYAVGLAKKNAMAVKSTLKQDPAAQKTEDEPPEVYEKKNADDEPAGEIMPEEPPAPAYETPQKNLRIIYIAITVVATVAVLFLMAIALFHGQNDEPAKGTVADAIQVQTSSESAPPEKTTLTDEGIGTVPDATVDKPVEETRFEPVYNPDQSFVSDRTEEMGDIFRAYLKAYYTNLWEHHLMYGVRELGYSYDYPVSNMVRANNNRRAELLLEKNLENGAYPISVNIDFDRPIEVLEVGDEFRIQLYELTELTTKKWEDIIDETKEEGKTEVFNICIYHKITMSKEFVILKDEYNDPVSGFGNLFMSFPDNMVFDAFDLLTVEELEPVEEVIYSDDELPYCELITDDKTIWDIVERFETGVISNVKEYTFVRREYDGSSKTYNATTFDLALDNTGETISVAFRYNSRNCHNSVVLPKEGMHCHMALTRSFMAPFEETGYKSPYAWLGDYMVVCTPAFFAPVDYPDRCLEFKRTLIDKCAIIDIDPDMLSVEECIQMFYAKKTDMNPEYSLFDGAVPIDIADFSSYMQFTGEIIRNDDLSYTWKLTDMNDIRRVLILSKIVECSTDDEIKCYYPFVLAQIENGMTMSICEPLFPEADPGVLAVINISMLNENGRVQTVKKYKVVSWTF